MYKNVCIVCGLEFESNSKNITVCKTCEEKIHMVKKIEMFKKANGKLKGRGILKNNNVEIHSEKVRERIIKGIDNFSSIPEVMMAIQMEMLEIQYETQKKIGNKKVDFYLPDLKIVLEIDGELYHTNDNESFLRDRHIMHYLDESWEIVHIDAWAIPRYTWDIGNALQHVLFQRKMWGYFRNSEMDEFFLEEYRDLELFMEGESDKGGNEKISRPSKKY